jgi:hypothetical protein
MSEVVPEDEDRGDDGAIGGALDDGGGDDEEEARGERRRLSRPGPVAATVTELPRGCDGIVKTPA